jgi:hypothetical protein
LDHAARLNVRWGFAFAISERAVGMPEYPRALGQLGIYCWINKKAVGREAIETQSVAAAKIPSFGPNEKIGANLRQ